MDELVIGDQKYISSKRAAEITGYAKDYVGQLCREGRVEARLVGRNWYIREAAIRDHRFGAVELEDPNPKKFGEEKAVRPTWEAPKYSKITEDDEIPVHKEVREENDRVVDAASQLQSAWQDWFANNARKIDQPASESPEIDHRETEIYEPVISRVEDSIAPEEESVPIQIHKNLEIEEVGEVAEDRDSEVVPEEKSILREHKIKEGGGQRSRTLLRASLLIVTVMVLASTFLSVGVWDIFRMNAPEVQLFQFFDGSRKYNQ